jgi:Cu(I)/Ag(I) efflux system membrane fusion protein/cobalt-zinc-cadmium efflux system membrane fusion protein
MKKVLFISLVSFVLGAAATALVLSDPFHWEWNRGSGNLLKDESVQLWTCSMHPDVLQEEPGNCPVCAMKLTPIKAETAKQLWTCGMHPQVLEDEPGNCPICAMKLTPVSDQTTSHREDEDSGTIQIDPVFVQNIGVQSEEITRTDIPFTIRTVGNLTYNDGQTVWVNTKYEGWIEKVYVNYVGEPVEKGQRLFEIYSPQLVTTQKEYLQALDYAQRMREGNYPEITARADSLLNSARERLSYWDVTPDQIEELETSREPRRTLAVMSPAGGLVVEKMDQALEGMYAKAGMNLYKIADLSTIWVEVEVFENQIPWLRVGQRALVELAYEPGKQYTGRVRYLYPFLDEKTRTMKVSVELPNSGRKLRADMYANVTFEIPSVRDVVAIPEESVIHSGTRNVAILDRGDGRFEVREITLGVNGSGLWEVKEGLSEGDRIVVSSQFLIDSESNLQEAIRKMVSEPGHQH